MVAIPNGPEPALGLYWYDNADPTIAPGMPAPLEQLLIRTDIPALYYKSGYADTDWTLIAGGVVPIPTPNLHVQNFRYTIVGGDLQSVIINGAKGFLPRASANYNVFVVPGKNAGAVGIEQLDPTTFTTTQFTLKFTANPTVGDSVLIFVADLA
jgi:hypothetical protein